MKIYGAVCAINLEILPGSDISTACEEAVEIARAAGENVSFSFNGVPVVAYVGDTVDEVFARWDKARRPRGGCMLSDLKPGDAFEFEGTGKSSDPVYIRRYDGHSYIEAVRLTHPSGRVLPIIEQHIPNTKVYPVELDISVREPRNVA